MHDTVPVQKSGSDQDTVQGSPAEVPVVDNSEDHLCIADFLNLNQDQDLKQTLADQICSVNEKDIPFSMNHQLFL